MALNTPQQQMLMMTVLTQVLRLQAQMALNLRISGRSLITMLRQVTKESLKLRKNLTLRLPSLYSLAHSRSLSRVALFRPMVALSGTTPISGHTLSPSKILALHQAPSASRLVKKDNFYMLCPKRTNTSTLAT